MLLDQAAQPLLDDMGIDLRRGDIGMPEQLLHRAKIGAALKEMAGESVAKDVRETRAGSSPAGGRAP